MASAGIRLRPFTEADLPFAMRLKTLAGWNQLEADWRRFLALEPGGCFVAEYEGQPAATVTALSHGQRFGWIGMMLVDPERRRLGIASALLDRAIEYLTSRGVETAKLDATPMGKTVYDQRDFVDEYRIERRVRPAQPAGSQPHSCRRILPQDLDRIAEFDAEFFGADRRTLLATLLRDAPELALQTNGGYVMGRRGANATQIGPLVAPSEAVAERLLLAALGAAGNVPTLIDVPVPNREADALSTRHGFTQQRELIRQYRGPNRFPGKVSAIFGIAGPELG